MPAKRFCLVVSSIDVRSLGVWVRCGAGARGWHLGARHVLVDVDPGVVELSVVIVYTSCGLGGPGVHRKWLWGDLGLESDVSERSCPLSGWRVAAAIYNLDLAISNYNQSCI